MVSPEALRHLAQKQLTEIFEPRAVSIQRSSLTWRGDAACEGIKIAEKTDFPPGIFLEIPRARFRVSLISLLKGKPAIKSIFLENPKVTLTRKNGVWNISDILTRLTPATHKGNSKFDPTTSGPKSQRPDFRGGGTKFGDGEAFPEILLSHARVRILFEEKPPRTVFVSGKMQKESSGFSAGGSLRDASALQNNLSFEVAFPSPLPITLTPSPLPLGEGGRRSGEGGGVGWGEGEAFSYGRPKMPQGL